MKNTVNWGFLVITVVLLILACNKDEERFNTPPVIKVRTFIAAENIADTTSIGTVLATDEDGDELTFTITKNDNHLFEMASDGTFSLAQGKSLDFTTAQKHTITVSVDDGADSTSAEVIIIVTSTNESPIIEAQSFTVPQNIDHTKIIGQVIAKDPDGDGISFAIIAQNDDNLFEITWRGILSLADGKSLDFAKAQKHTITVAVGDNEASASTQVTIIVTKVDEIPVVEPQTFNVPENTDHTVDIGPVVATHPQQETLTFTLIDNANGLFTITENGAINLTEGKILDFEGEENQYQITVEASDSFDNSTEATITINVTDVDEAPIFTGSDEFEAPEDITPAETIAELTAEDPEGGNVSFTIINDNELFKIDPNSGILSLHNGQSLDFEAFNGATPIHHIVIRISDEAQNYIDVPVSVLVLDVLDQLPNEPETSFITTWKTTNLNEEIRIGVDTSFGYDFVVDWGDGNLQEFNFHGQDFISHSYETPGDYSVAIQGSFPAIKMGYNDNIDLNFRKKLIGIQQWGNIEWLSMKEAFARCKKLSIYNAIIPPNLTKVTVARRMFLDINYNPDVTNWDTQNIEDMSSMFNYTSFNRDLSNWNLQNVKLMKGMFSNSSMTPENYSATLVGWANQENTPVNVNFVGQKTMEFCQDNPVVQQARQDLLNQGWQISEDSGVDCN